VEPVKALRHLNITAALLIAFINAIDCIDQNVGLWQYLAFAAPFLIFAGVLMAWKDYKVNAVVYAISGITQAAFGNPGDFSGAVLIMFSLYIYSSAKTNTMLLGSVTLAIISRHLFMGYTIPDTINLLVAYVFVLGVYFILMHPKPAPEPIVIKVDEEALETVQLLRSGMTVKEAAAEQGITQSGVYHRRDKVRKAYRCASNDELYMHLEKIGLVSVKTDNPA
jgi:hypothetical protein